MYRCTWCNDNDYDNDNVSDNERNVTKTQGVRDVASSSLQHSSAFHRLAIPQRCYLQKACFGKNLFTCLRIHVNSKRLKRDNPFWQNHKTHCFLKDLRLQQIYYLINMSKCLGLVWGDNKSCLQDHMSRWDMLDGVVQRSSCAEGRWTDFFILVYSSFSKFAFLCSQRYPQDNTDRIKDRFWKEEQKYCIRGEISPDLPLYSLHLPPLPLSENHSQVPSHKIYYVHPQTKN